MAKGDYIEVTTGFEKTTIAADKAGRQVDGEFVTDGKISWYKAELQSRSGKVIESIQVPAENVHCLKVHKKDE